MKSYFPPFFHCHSSPKSTEKAWAPAVLTQLLLQLHWDPLHIIPYQMQWLFSGQGGGSLCLGIMTPCTWEMLQTAHLQMLNFTCHLEIICSSWRQPITLEDAPWWLCWQACGTEHLVLPRCEVWLHSTLKRKGINVDNKCLAPSLKPQCANLDKLSNSRWLSECLNHTASFICL